MSAAMLFLVVFAAAWLAVACSTVAHFTRPPQVRRDIALLARAGLLIWFTGIIAATFAEVRHWPASQITQMGALGLKCKVTGFIVLVVGLALRRRPRREAAGGEPPSNHGGDHA
jgi:hypothetical protein